ncbi:MAG: NAD(P)-dependent oxidoreductase [Myxococcota bacterium]|jgi:D-3-phosphoglycerate dehydrogenase|nr:NAD(P)-dependent oxidoreductase [Myxococcota bacterium]
MKVLVADKFEAFGLQSLKELGFEVDFQPDLSTEQLPEVAKTLGCEVLIVRSTKVPAAVFEAAAALRLVVRAGAGYDTIDIAAAGAKGVAVANCPGTNSTAVAELVIGLMIAADRRIPAQVADLRQGKWDKKGYAKARGIKGSTLGVIGMGTIGRLVAQRALALEMQVLYSDIVACTELDANPNVRRVSVDDVFAQADVITLHVPGSGDTKHLVNNRSLGLMKKHALLINTSRGTVVDTAALAAALREGRIGGAALDVYENEPAATDTAINNELLSLPNFIGTHHVGASTDQAQNAVAELAVEIIKTFRDTQNVMHCVNKDSLKV